MANIYDQIINGTFANPAMQTQGWGQPVGNTPRQGTVNSPYLRQGASGVRFNPGEGFVPGAIPTGGDRLPQGTAGLPAPAGTTGMTPQQLQALGGWAIDPRTGQLAYSAPGAQNPAVAAATQQGQNVPLPRPRPATAPSWMDMAAINAQQQPVGANPGMGGAMIGNGQMAPGIPPQGPPPAGIAPTVWAGDQPQQAGGGGQPLGISVHGGQQPNVSPSERYSLANMLGQINAQKRQSNATGTAGGYQYQNGQKVGYAPQTIGGSTYTPMSGASAYSLANLAGQQAAQQRQANATGSTGVYNYVNGQRTGTVNGGSSASAYEAAAARSRDPGTSGEGGNPSWW